MRILQRLTIALFVLVLFIFAGTKLYASRYIDRVPPVITCDDDVLEISVRAPERSLLRGVSASDDRDGDLTEEVMVKGVTQLITADTAKVTYVVFDSSNNMATYSRTVRYTDYEKPHFSLSRGLVYPVGGSVTLLDRLTATDVIDGDISDNIRVTTQNVTPNYEGVYNVTVQVTNSLGDTESLPLKVVVSHYAPVNPPITLTDYILYLDQGASFDPADYISPDSDPTGIEIDSHVDTSTSGVYHVCYTSRTYMVYLTVVVK